MRRTVFACIGAIAVVVALAAATPAGAVSIKPYRGAGTWVDIYDPGIVWQNPAAVVDELSYQGVRTLYVETGNYHFGPLSASISRPAQQARFLDAAHAAGIKVVAWYLPGLANYRLDRRRAFAALDFRTAAGNRYDSFALDIEASLTRSISKRNAAALKLTRAIRRHAGRGYPLGAIVPDSKSTSFSTSLWPGFPYRSLNRYYDVFVPMAYSVYRVHGPSRVYAYTRLNIDLIRARTGDARVPVHVIGGLSGGLSRSEANAVVSAADDDRAVGASFYSFRSSRQYVWDALVRLR